MNFIYEGRYLQFTSYMLNKRSELFFLFDAYYILYRSYYAFINKPQFNSKGFNTSVILGFMNTVLNVLNKHQPNYIGFIFDKSNKNTFRHKEYINYKANRKKSPALIKESVPYILKILSAFNINYIIYDNYEADDVIATLSVQASKELYVYIVTSDKDLSQLVTNNIKIYKLERYGLYSILGIHEVCLKYNVCHPDRIVDFFAMLGDVSDNIPGIPGIGEKTASKLINQYGTLENIIKNINNITGLVKKKLIKYKDLGLLSKKLFTLDLNISIKFHKNNFIFKNPNYDKIVQIFKELNFVNLLYRVKKFLDFYFLDFKKNIPHVIKKYNSIYQVVDNLFNFNIFKDKLLSQKEVSFYISYSFVNNKYLIQYISFTWNKDMSYYIFFNDDNIKNIKNIILKELGVFFSNKGILKICYNVKLIMRILHFYNIILKDPFYDIMIASFLLNNNHDNDLNIILKNYLNIKFTYFIINENALDVNIINYIKYSNILLYLKFIFHSLIIKNNLSEIFFTIDLSLIKILFNMELSGILINNNKLLKLFDEYNNKIQKIIKNIFKYSKCIFNVNSPKELSDVLFKKIMIKNIKKKTKKGYYSTSLSVLNKIISDHKVIKYIIKYRQTKKIQSSYINLFLKHIYNSKIHTTFSQTSSNTGRIISYNPNLQNIPLHNSLHAKKIRSLFIPHHKHSYILSADYSQIELRLMAHFSKDDNLINSFNTNLDVYSIIASKIFNINITSVKKYHRYIAKTVNFGILYGITPFGLSKQIDISLKESKDIINNYFDRYKGIKKYIINQIKKVRMSKFVKTITGRIFYLPEICSDNILLRKKAERNAINTPIQGSVSDLIKISMIKLYDIFHKRKIKSIMIMNIHDELIFNVYEHEISEVKLIIKDTMESVLNISIPLIVNIGIGRNLYDLKY